MQRAIVIFSILLGLYTTAAAEIVDSSASWYKLRHQATSSLAPDELWQRLVNPAAWWHPDHTYSGDAGNLSLDLRPGGLWLETWDDGAVAHGEVLLVQEGRTLRMNAPFGPLQGSGAYTIWTITIEASDEGSRVVFDEVANAPAPGDMTELAKAVDFVKTEAINRLVAE